MAALVNVIINVYFNTNQGIFSLVEDLPIRRKDSILLR